MAGAGRGQGWEGKPLGANRGYSAAISSFLGRKRSTL